ncbi:GMC oxidoreductase [Amylocystis lapponica]|nr:GMC oxidoreductase [Amylocystis lapponica]
MERKLASLHDVSDKSFDFIIIGKGESTAGLVLANRLTENPQVSVVVLEAGKANFDDPLITTPHGWLRQHNNPDYDWAFSTVSQPTLGGISLPWARGKGLGGSSSLNFLIYTRPQCEEWDALETLGNPGWNWETFHKYSKKSERYGTLLDPTRRTAEYQDLVDPDAMGHDGPLSISFARTATGTEHAFQKVVAMWIFLVTLTTYFLMRTIKVCGVWKTISSIDPATETRSSAATAYLLPVIGRTNLTVLTGANVNKIVTRKENGELVASGVDFEYGGTIYRVNASKEVILSASTIKSPQILELSGIGDQAILEPLHIPVQLHLPSIGTNVQDHVVLVAHTYEMHDGHHIVTSNLLRDPEHEVKLREFYDGFDGPLSLALNGLAFVPAQAFSDRITSLIEQQSAKIATESTSYPPGLKEQYEVQLNLLKNERIPETELLVNPFLLPVYTPADRTLADSKKPFVQIVPSTARPWSRGTIHISSADPKAQPAINPHYLEEDIDMELLLDAFKFARKVCATEPFKSLVVSEYEPGEHVVSDEDLRAHIKAHLVTIWHACGSLSMLPRDKGGVVDPKLKVVYGTQNIRVVDLSILPLLTAVHTQAVVYGIAEQAADIIKTDYDML